MQTGISVDGNAISGTLHKVTDYTDFSSKPEDQSGNYLAIEIADSPKADKITAELINGTSDKGPVPLDEDRIFIAKISNKDTQSIKIVATKNCETSEKTYTLTGLTLEEE